MAKPACAVPGPFASRPFAPKPHTVVKLKSGEKVHLLASPTGHKKAPAPGPGGEASRLQALPKPPSAAFGSPGGSSAAAPTPKTAEPKTAEPRILAGASAVSSPVALRSPEADVSFSPRDRFAAEAQAQVKHAMAEVVHSEYVFVKCLQLLGKFFVEPVLVRCAGLGLTCTPLLNMERMVHGLTQKHEHFLGRVNSDPTVATYSAEVKRMFAGSAYGAYAGCAQVLLALIHRSVPPFESPYIDHLQRFLERTQPGDQRMDLSLSSLLQKPMGRIAKYRLFLAAVAKHSADPASVHRTSEDLNRHLVAVNAQIEEHRKREYFLDCVARSVDFTVTGLHCVHFFGLINYTCHCTVHYISAERRQRVVASHYCKIMVHDYHISVAENRPPRLLFVLPFGNCSLLPAKSTTALHSNGPSAFKIIFEKSAKQYELMITAESVSATRDLFVHCAEITERKLQLAKSDRDCYSGAPVAEYGAEKTRPSQETQTPHPQPEKKRWLGRMW